MSQYRLTTQYKIASIGNQLVPNLAIVVSPMTARMELTNQYRPYSLKKQVIMLTNLYDAHRQWALRPPDEFYLQASQ